MQYILVAEHMTGIREHSVLSRHPEQRQSMGISNLHPVVLRLCIQGLPARVFGLLDAVG